jgi:hypothetical protein
MLLDCKQSADTGKNDKIVDNDTEKRQHKIKWLKHIGIIEHFNIPVFHEATAQCDHTDIGGPDGKTIFILLLHFKVR